jgi:hypothetical protein
MPDWLFQLVTAGAAACGVYAAIRADLARLHERATQAMQAAQRAHERIDSIHHHRSPGP